jgi:hypothetical protein
MHSKDYIPRMAWDVAFTDEFGMWWDTLTDSQQGDVAAYVGRLEMMGPQLPFPYSSGIKGSRHDHMRELRVQSHGDPLRVFYAFDPHRSAILLIGGDKTGRDRFYQDMIPVADALYDVHIAEVTEKGRNKI